MTLEEVLAWCVKHEVTVQFFFYEGKPMVVIHGGQQWMLGKGETFVQAVQKARVTMWERSEWAG
jgi:hypothetical protein